MTAIGCVWAAHRALAEQMERARETDVPSYAWCEEQWTSGLRKVAPRPAALPDAVGAVVEVAAGADRVSA